MTILDVLTLSDAFVNHESYFPCYLYSNPHSQGDVQNGLEILVHDVNG